MLRRPHHHQHWRGILLAMPLLIPPHPSQNLVGSKLVYRAKYHFDGFVERYKAGLIAQGFHQRAGIDYYETFSPIVKLATIRLILSLAVSFQQSMRQLDIKNVFLHRHLTEEIYMKQPRGFIHLDYPHYVCKLQKALYDLKQAPRAWFHRFNSFLLSHGFVCGSADPSMFVLRTGSHILVLLLYADDIILTGSSSMLLSSFISTLSNQFAMKDLRDLHYFLGIQVKRDSMGIFLSHHTYVDDLHKFHLHVVKPVATPSAACTLLSLTDGELLTDPSEYRSLVGSFTIFDYDSS